MEGYSYSAACIRGQKPNCETRCPFGMDARAFVRELKNGRFDAAYHLYANSVLFPDIVWRLCRGCVDCCPAGLSLPELERACVENAKNREPSQFNLPQKEQRVAIIGAGLSGLACAARLAARGYDVTVYEKSDAPGGSLGSVMERGIYLSEFAARLETARIRLLLNSEVRRLDDVAFDAAYICTGSGGSELGLRGANADKARFRGVVLGGGVTGANHIDALAHGLDAAVAIENYFKLGSFGGEQSLVLTPRGTRLGGPPARLSPEEARARAASCTGCDCSLCKNGCELMKLYDTFPRRLERDCTAVSRPTKPLMTKNHGKAAIFSCSLCGHCGASCPVGVSMKDMMLTLKQKQFEYGGYPPALHDYYLRDMDSALGEGFLSSAPRGSADYAFFPGCGMSASDPQLALAAYDYIRAHDDSAAILLACCGIPALWAGDKKRFDAVCERLRNEWIRLGKPTLLLACASCFDTFSRYLPEIRCVSVYEYILAHGVPAAGSLGGERAVLDPCAGSAYPAMQSAVRETVRLCGAEPRELADSGVAARCCGNGGHIYTANKALFENMLSSVAAQSELPYICYCSNCRDNLLSIGKDSAHILELALGFAPKTKPPHISELRENRRWLKNTLLKMPSASAPQSTAISEALLRKMDSLLISAEDIAETIEFCERGHTGVRNEATGAVTGCMQRNFVTCWVEYRTTGDKKELVNAYSHRMSVSRKREAIPGGSGGAQGSPLRCVSCGAPMEIAPVQLEYLNQTVKEPLPVCPVCGYALISEELALGKLHELETMIEGK